MYYQQSDIANEIKKRMRFRKVKYYVEGSGRVSWGFIDERPDSGITDRYNLCSSRNTAHVGLEEEVKIVISNKGVVTSNNGFLEQSFDFRNDLTIDEQKQLYDHLIDTIQRWRMEREKNLRV